MTVIRTCYAGECVMTTRYVTKKKNERGGMYVQMCHVAHLSTRASRTWLSCLHVWHDTDSCIYMCDMTQALVFICVTWHRLLYLHVRHDTGSGIYMCDMTQALIFTCVTWHRLSYLHVWHDTLTRARQIRAHTTASFFSFSCFTYECDMSHIWIRHAKETCCI